MRYPNPPLGEALVELRFSPGEPWDATLPGRLYDVEAIRTRYSKKPQTLPSWDVRADFVGGQPGAVTFGAAPSTVRFESEDGADVAIVGPHAISVHRVGAYPGWATFRKSVHEVVDGLVQLDAGRRVARLGVRYINRFPPKTSDSMLAVGPRRAADWSVHEHLSRVVVNADDDDIVVVTAHQPAGEAPVVLDLDAIRAFDPPVEVQDVLNAVDRLKRKLSTTFENAITDEARARFSVEPDSGGFS